MRFVEVADRVYVLRYPILDVNSTLIVGDGEALLVDTLATGRQAADLGEAARAITSFPWALVNTHHHFDHCFGNAALADPIRPVWAHEEANRLLLETAEAQRAEWIARWSESDPVHAEDLARVEVRGASDTFAQDIPLDLGGRLVHLRHLGHGHTAGDIVVHVPDAGVVVAGDLVEESAAPSYGDDSYPLHWPETVAALLRLDPLTTIVPGHGAPVDPAFVKAQHEDLTTVEWTLREAYGDGAPVEDAVRAVLEKSSLALTDTAARSAVRRAYADLSGTTS
ncbi:MBL fold metallo-hydrolase [Catenuloplanes atrovinosus]|uniref:Glyoxylase-like metal-dependent hydrolase (Beta-lactamase superfamily II) n=1 Tax=Catenuloplanes atrovinosus TaxID=137266 RepID=A0AAE4CAU0_9ACTN|nr:MBL fold metallo-hydrolase [Catenuloplanes atrovinosus]MDR7277946.1 glyoxylase-like metal-dependent hydrolase (beta-lactamase superfamily II) [Catenuloplanes atrovinosus]